MNKRFTAFLVAMTMTLFIFFIGVCVTNNELTLGTLLGIQFMTIAYITGQSGSDAIKYYKNNDKSDSII
jgi:hypothetical protein